MGRRTGYSQGGRVDHDHLPRRRCHCAHRWRRISVLLPKTDEETAHAVMQRIRSSRINENGNRVCAYSHWLSLGVATAHAMNELEATLKGADDRMYRDKKAINRHLSLLPPFESNEIAGK